MRSKPVGQRTFSSMKLCLCANRKKRFGASAFETATMNINEQLFDLSLWRADFTQGGNRLPDEACDKSPRHQLRHSLSTKFPFALRQKMWMRSFVVAAPPGVVLSSSWRVIPPVSSGPSARGRACPLSGVNPRNSVREVPPPFSSTLAITMRPCQGCPWSRHRVTRFPRPVLP
jgi:hypothetical protein